MDLPSLLYAGIPWWPRRPSTSTAADYVTIALGPSTSSQWNSIDLKLHGLYALIPASKKLCTMNLGPEPIAYVISTSGTTSTAKVVAVPHACIVPNVLAVISEIGLKETDLLFGATVPTFDPSIVELFGALATGATIVFAPVGDIANPVTLHQIVRDSKISVLCGTPSLLQRVGTIAWNEDLLALGSCVRAVLMGGERLPPWDLLRHWWPEQSETVIYNLYGLTECSCWAMIQPIARSEAEELLFDGQLPLGHALCGNDVAVEDSQLIIQLTTRMPCFNVTQGEMFPVNLPTGDVVNVQDITGKPRLYFEGRVDSEIKRFGHRLNLDLISSQLACLVGASAWYLMDQHDILHAFVVSDSLSSTDVMKAARHQLPPHAVPDLCHIRESMHITNNGKVDLKTTLQQVCTAPNDSDTIDAGSRVKLVLSQMGFETNSLDVSFLEVGGDSLSALTFCNLLLQGSHVRATETGDILAGLLDTVLSQPLSVVVVALSRDSFHLHAQALPVDEDMKVATVANGKLAQSQSDFEVRFVAERCHSPSLSSMKDLVRPVWEPQWRSKLGKCVDASPLIVDFVSSHQDRSRTMVYIGSHAHNMSAFDGADGNKVWEAVLPDRVEGSAALSPDGKFVCVGCYDGALYVLDAQDGAIWWHVQTGGPVKGAPCQDAVTRAIIFGSHDGVLRAVNVNDKQMLWSFKSSEKSMAIFAAPAMVRTQTVVFCDLAGHVRAVNTSSGSLLWSQHLPKPVFSSPQRLGSQSVIVGCVDHSISCFDTSTGEIQWSFDTEGPIFSSPHCFQDQSRQVVAFGSHDNHVYLVASGILLWRVLLDGRVFASPCVARNKTAGQWWVVVCTTPGSVYVLDHHGNIVQRHILPCEVFSSPVLVNGYCFVGCRDDYLHKIKVFETE